MRLSELIGDGRPPRDPGPAGPAADGALDPEVRGIASDSRAVRPGYLFAALPGSRTDGRRFIPDAVARGAVAVLAPRGTRADWARPPAAGPVRLIADANPRRRLAIVAARFHGAQPERIAAVTGTNGKTSVAEFARQIWTARGRPAASLGTLGLTTADGRSGPGLTTPDPVCLHAALRGLAGRGIDRLAIEASSHGLDQHRLDGVRVRAAAFTNLSRDHLDYHRSMPAYLAAKTRLFAELLAPDGTAVLNVDAPEHAPLAEACRRRGVRVVGYGRGAGADLALLESAPAPGGSDIAIRAGGAERRLFLPLPGGFQAANALAALGLVMALEEGGPGPDPDWPGALAELSGVPGRLGLAGTHPSGAPVYVDYAHTPDALRTMLAALRPHVAGRLVCVFGAGGDRDPGKRAEMGRAAAQGADAAIVADDNPRSEDPAAIRRAVLAGCPGAREIGDRAEAIAAGIALLRAGDALVVAGKGHERGQVVGDRVLPFDDTEAARDALAAIGGRPA